MHQTASTPETRLTTNRGVPRQPEHPVGRTARGRTCWKMGPAREKIQHFDHERIPERIVHVRGSAAHGAELTESPADHTTAKILTEVGKQIELFHPLRPY
jgi:catalase